LQEVPESQPIDKGSGTDKPALVKYAAKRLHHQGRSMSSPQTTNPQQACEAILIEGKRYNIEHGIRFWTGQRIVHSGSVTPCAASSQTAV
jgi:hypothetical protein